jgi:membrane protease YdiL (CAAX protease family)
VRQLLACIATAGTLGVALTMATRLARPDAEPLTTRAVAIALMWFLLYLPVAFVLEEVFFRGAVDAHVHHPGEPRGIASAVIVSALWALWHLPIVPARQAVTATLAGLLAVHVAVGIPLSVYWRRSGNLAVPATTHAFIDAMRNALLS